MINLTLGIFMTGKNDIAPITVSETKKPYGLAYLVCFHIFLCCASLVDIARYNNPIAFSPEAFHIFFDPTRWYVALAAVGAFASISLFFIFARFSFGYFSGFYFYTMILGYLWLNCFTDLNYDHRLAGLSAAASAVTFLLPALFISSPIRQIYMPTAKSFDRLLTCLLMLGVATVAIGAIYNFRLVSPADMYEYRAKLDAPASVNYLVTIVSIAVLPFVFAGFITIKARGRAVVVLLLLPLFYPITLNKMAIFTSPWLVVMLLIAKLFEARIAVILSLVGPMLAGLVLFSLFEARAALVLSTVNFRMIAIPSVAMDVYNDFFSRHELTYFCQISFLRASMHCPYQEQLSIIMERTYKLGNFNASLFATEGIASVGVLFAPFATFLCGLVIALGNRFSAGLPAGFILVSGAVVAQALLNVPLTTGLLTYGAGPLFLLWYITPRAIFPQPVS